MKTQLLTIFLLALMAAPEAFAQTRRGNGNRGGSVNRGGTPPSTTPTRVDRNRPNRNGSTVRRNTPTTRPAPTPAPNRRDIMRDNARRNARTNNPPTVNPNRRPDVRPTPVNPGRVNPNHRRPVVVRRTGPVTRRVNPYRPSRTYYGTQRYYNPYGYTHRAYSPYRHQVMRYNFRHSVRYSRPYNYYRYVRDYYRNYIYLNWILYPSVRGNGYYQVDNYPYYVYNGYRHRYSEYDSCNYQLVDKYTHQVVRTYWNETCFSGYNNCAIERDQMNSRMYDNRYMCAETFRDDRYDFGRPTYDYEYEDDLYNDYGYEDDYYYDEYDDQYNY